MAGHDKAAYQANYAEDLERRALEIREKGNVVEQHEQVETENVVEN